MKTKKSFIALAMVAFMLTFGLGLVREASALDNNGFFESAAERDAWILAVLERQPLYMFAQGDELDTQIGLLATMIVGDVAYQPNDGAAMSGLMVYIKHSVRGKGGIAIFFCRDEAAVASARRSSFARAAGADGLFGPFNAGSTDASRRAALERILASITSHLEDDTRQTQWR